MNKKRFNENISLQKQYDNIYSFFKTTTEYFDELEWDGKKNKCVV